MLEMVTSENIRLSESVVSVITVGDAVGGYIEGGVVRYSVVWEAVVECKKECADGFSVSGRVTEGCIVQRDSLGKAHSVDGPTEGGKVEGGIVGGCVVGGRVVEGRVVGGRVVGGRVVGGRVVGGRVVGGRVVGGRVVGGLVVGGRVVGGRVVGGRVVGGRVVGGRVVGGRVVGGLVVGGLVVVVVCPPIGIMLLQAFFICLLTCLACL